MSEVGRPVVLSQRTSREYTEDENIKTCFEFGTFLVKYFLCLLNFVFFVAGNVALAAGIWIAFGAHSFLEFIRSTFGDELITEFQQITHPTVIELAAYILLAAGALVFLISFIGYWGAFRESRCFLTCYGLLIILILLLEITAAVLATTYTHEAEENIRAFLKSSIKEYNAAEGKDAVTLMWDYTMVNAKCCGVDSYEDFKESKKWTQGNKIIPEACCVLEGDVLKLQPKDPDCTKRPSDSNSYWKKGCYNALLEFVREFKVTPVGIGIGLTLFKLLVIILAF
jgi:tetraspanin-18